MCSPACIETQHLSTRGACDPTGRYFAQQLELKLHLNIHLLDLSGPLSIIESGVAADPPAVAMA